MVVSPRTAAPGGMDEPHRRRRKPNAWHYTLIAPNNPLSKALIPRQTRLQGRAISSLSIHHLVTNPTRRPSPAALPSAERFPHGLLHHLLASRTGPRGRPAGKALGGSASERQKKTHKKSSKIHPALH